MKQINPMLLIDYYKAVHAEMLPEKMTKSVSYFTPRMSRIDRWDKVVMFGLQGFIKTYLIDYFKRQFFNRPFETVLAEYKRVLDNTLGEKAYGIEKIEKLHRLGFLPVEIVALPEGTRVPVHVPMFGITNTHPDFAWLPQALGEGARGIRFQRGRMHRIGHKSGGGLVSFFSEYGDGSGRSLSGTDVLLRLCERTCRIRQSEHGTCGHVQ